MHKTRFLARKSKKIREKTAPLQTDPFPGGFPKPRPHGALILALRVLDSTRAYSRLRRSTSALNLGALAPDASICPLATSSGSAPDLIVQSNNDNYSVNYWC